MQENARDAQCHRKSVARRHVPPIRRCWRQLAITIIAAATLAGAWFFQLVLDIRPCPLCLEQRYAYYLAVPLGLLVAFAASRGAPRPLLLAGLAILLLAALYNAYLGAYHAGVEWKFWQGPTDCTGPVGNLGSAGNLLERLDTVKVIRCDEVQWRFLGLSLAGYNVLISLLMAAIAAWGLASPDPTGQQIATYQRETTCPVLNAKNIPLSPSGKSALQLAPSRPQEGRSRSSRTLGWDAVDAAARETSATDAYGEVVWS